MNRAEWQRAKSLLVQAADLPPADREPFITEHCEDPDLRRELLDLLNSPAPLSAIVGADALRPGDQLGPYRIEALLGIGGMGEVYRARDTRLKRDVALKVIAPRFAGVPSLRYRFERESRAASALNHPAIVTVYDVGETDDISWIAMEWVDGRTLRQVLAAGPLPVRDVCSITRQIADGLAAAHDKGIVHRDLKPENVMLTSDGRTKILDFGLARHMFAGSLEDSQADGGTAAATVAASLEGTILGTAGYMSPEQASGRTADFRSDQFSLGVLAYEMLAGRRAFSGATVVETLSAIIRDEPVPVTSIRRDTPDALAAIVARCLAKRPEARFASTRDLVAALPTAESQPLGHDGGGRALYPTFPVRRVVAGIISVAAAALLAVSGWSRFGVSRHAIESIAVLPLENQTSDSATEYLSSGLTESLIDRLSRVPSLTVMARGTVFHFKGTTDPLQAGRTLGVGAIVTGTVAGREKHLIVSAELIEVATGARLWGESYDRPIADLQRVQDSIASDIADRLRLRLSGQERRLLVAHGTEDSDAYDLFLKGRHLLASASEEDDLEARKLFQQALERDPRFVDAHLGVAATYARSVGEGYAPPAEAWRHVDDELRKVAAIDPANVRARVAAASRRFQFDWDWKFAEREYLELSADPRVAGLGPQFQPIAMFFWAEGRPEKAIALIERALQVDPEDIESRIMMAGFLVQAGRLDEALAQYRSIAAREPANAGPFYGMAEIFRRRGDTKDAIDALRKAYEYSGEEHGARLLATARTDADYDNAEIAVARDQLQDLQALAKERYVSPLYLARLYARLDDRDNAFSYLELAFSERSMGMVLLKVDRAWDRIRDDARFAALVRRVGIP